MPTDVYYASDNLVSVMGCIDQTQIRDPTTNNTTVLSGLQSLAGQVSNIGLNLAQVATASRFIIPSEQNLMFNSVNGLQTAALKAQDSLFITLSSGLPDDQWQIELRGWFDTALARVQSSMVDFVSKDIAGFAQYANLTVWAGTTNVEAMCDNQKILAIGNYQSFSMMGVEIIAILGTFIIGLSFLLEKIVGFFQKKGKRKYKQVLWNSDEILQQQKRALSRIGENEWEEKDGDVPVTKMGKVWKAGLDGDG